MSRIRLICHMGTTPGENLVRHFMDHYYRSGVDEFLVILHSERGDNLQRQKVLSVLQKYGVRPVMEVNDYCYIQKKRRINAVMDRYCQDRDWVIQSDLDEFQAYPAGLHRMVQLCDQNGYKFVAGKWIDRIAREGQLKPISIHPSLWQQFQFSCDISEKIVGGWCKKICLMQGSLRIGDGGMHSIEYGHPDWAIADLNYQQTHKDQRGCPVKIDIHHFKWDSTVIERLQNRSERYKRLGLSVYAESERVLKYIEKNGGVKMKGMKYTATPPLTYARPGKIAG